MCMDTPRCRWVSHRMTSASGTSRRQSRALAVAFSIAGCKGGRRQHGHPPGCRPVCCRRNPGRLQVLQLPTGNEQSMANILATAAGLGVADTAFTSSFSRSCIGMVSYLCPEGHHSHARAAHTGWCCKVQKLPGLVMPECRSKDGIVFQTGMHWTAHSPGPALTNSLDGLCSITNTEQHLSMSCAIACNLSKGAATSCQSHEKLKHVSTSWT